ncbi:AzlD domain-containing protein [Allosediminivita pacifica]|uniref:Branched-subunit amino acid transport protein n=1 Tax=Allosediminivita pacifica TaxID=1267769 RepID=A0A2T6B3Q6_9RHOB|nr:AzlD domain-containing protein [Allosediminivita pacifica]PTX50691.1 branched-subunit amino acid transport protein [Allosediminivita pacifica]GGB00428.1 membrane protein [Allosediminivita pacifica]
MIEDKVELWVVIFGLGLGSFGLRFLFLGLVGDRTLPGWLMRHLRYTPVAILPALVAPLVLWPTSTDGEVDPGRILAAFVALAVGYVSKNVIAAILSGAAAFAVLAWIGL